MYSLALIIFVVSEKKAFEYFPIGSNVNLVLRWWPSWISDRHKKQTVCRGPSNDHPWAVCDMKFKMAATAGLSLTLDPMGKMFKCLLLWNHLDNWNQTAQEWSLEGRLQSFVFYFDRKSKSIKNRQFVEDLPMIIPGQFGFNCPSGFREEAFLNIFPIGSKFCFLFRSEIQDGCNRRT
jgi:hypothetical protein